MTSSQKKCIEDEINIIQGKIDEAKRFMGIDNFFHNTETAKRWSRLADQYCDQLEGMRIVLSVLGYNIGWKNGKQFISDK